MFGASLKREFDRIVAIHTAKNIRLGEVNLFNILAIAFGNFNKSHVDIIHSNAKSGTTFNMPFSYYPQASIPATRLKTHTSTDCELTCELADLIVISYNAELGIAKLTCMQNKLERNMKNDQFYADVFQLYLLKHRPQIIKSNYSPATTDFLKCATLPSITSYGVFYDNGVNLDMNYYRADLIDLSINKSYNKQYSKVKFEGNLNQIDKRNDHIPILNDIQGVNGLVGFGDSLESLIIGTPIDKVVKKAINYRIEASGTRSEAINKFSRMTLNDDYSYIRRDELTNFEKELSAISTIIEKSPLIFIDTTMIIED